MNPEITIPLAKILSLRLKPKSPFSFGSDLDDLYAEQIDTQTRFSITEWQMHLLLGMHGEKSLGELLHQSELKIDRDFSPKDLLSFCAKLGRNDVIASVSAHPPAADPHHGNSDHKADEQQHHAPKENRFTSIIKRFSDHKDRTIKIACYALTFLGIVRLAWIVAPVFEPVLERIDVEVTRAVQKDDINPTPKINQTALLAERAPQTAKVESIEISGKSRQIERLREQLAGCRIRRDEYYLQNNEVGYRRELEAMTSLTRKIGELKTAE